jgi:hypothetical protein
VDFSIGVMENRRKKRMRKGPGADFFDEAGGGSQLDRLSLMRIDDPDRLAQFRAHCPDRCHEIGIIRNDDGNLVRVRETINEKLGCHRFTSEPFSFMSMTATLPEPSAFGRFTGCAWNDPRKMSI